MVNLCNMATLISYVLKECELTIERNCILSFVKSAYNKLPETQFFGEMT